MKKTVIIFFVGLLSTIAFGQSVAKRIKEYNLENKIAIQGYDPVAYFNQKKAVKGKPAIATTYEGVIYNFSSQVNKDLFLKNPSSFEPQYGGWCAYAMGSSSDKVEINPTTFKIINGKLYLFYNAFFNNTLKSWNKNEENLKKNAESNWAKVLN